MSEPISEKNRRELSCTVIRGVEHRLRNAEHWTRREFARNAIGDKVDWSNPAAVMWCVLGAVHCEGDKVNVGIYEIERVIEAKVPEQRRNEALAADKRIVPYWNDHPATTHAEVCTVLAAARRMLCPDDPA